VISALNFIKLSTVLFQRLGGFCCKKNITQPFAWSNTSIHILNLQRQLYSVTGIEQMRILGLLHITFTSKVTGFTS